MLGIETMPQRHLDNVKNLLQIGFAPPPENLLSTNDSAHRKTKILFMKYVSVHIFINTAQSMV